MCAVSTGRDETEDDLGRNTADVRHRLPDRQPVCMYTWVCHLAGSAVNRAVHGRRTKLVHDGRAGNTRAASVA
jgi:hypothetical protein